MKVPRRHILTSAAAVASGQVTLAAAKVKVSFDRAVKDAIAQGAGVVQLPAGRYETDGITVESSIRIEGVPGQTIVLSRSNAPALTIRNCQDVSMFGLQFDGGAKIMRDDAPALVVGQNVKRLSIDQCSFENSGASGLKLEECSGEVRSCTFISIKDTGLWAVDSKGLRIINSDVSDIGNNGVLISQSEIREDGTQVLGNRISHIRADFGGSGQYGNGIVIFRAGNVIAANNRIHDTAFSGIRCNSGNNVQYLGNSISRVGEAALYVEFNHQGAVVADNIVDGAAHGISIANIDVNGRMATCTGNIIRNIGSRDPANASDGIGIQCESETLVANNVIEDVRGSGIRLGWSGQSRNIMAQSNIIRKCDRGIIFTMVDGARQFLIAGNIIDDTVNGAIVGMDHDKAVTADFMKGKDKLPMHVQMYGNVATG